MVKKLGSSSIGLRKIHDGVNQYVFIRYSPFIDGKEMTDKPNDKSKYMGVYTSTIDVPSNDPTKYNWMVFQGASSFLWIRYSVNKDGNPMTSVATDATKYIGVSTTSTNVAPTDFKSYSWSRIKGDGSVTTELLSTNGTSISDKQIQIVSRTYFETDIVTPTSIKWDFKTSKEETWTYIGASPTTGTINAKGFTLGTNFILVSPISVVNMIDLRCTIVHKDQTRVAQTTIYNTTYVEKNFETLIYRNDSPPVNPSLGIMWMDTSSKPNFVYRWGYFYDSIAEANVLGWIPISAKEASDISWVTNEDGSTLADWIFKTETQISDQNIISTVLQSQDFTSVYDNTAKYEDLVGLASSEELEKQLEEYKKLLQDGIDGIDFTPYAKSSDLEQLATSITGSITQTGGVNMLKNSTGFADYDFFETKGDSLKTDQNAELEALGFGSAFIMTGNNYADQEIIINTPGTYTISCFTRKTTTTGAIGRVGVELYDKFDKYLGFIGSPESFVQPNLSKSSITISLLNPDTIKVRVISWGGPNTTGTIAGIMFNVGSLPLQWQPYPSEIYNTNVRLDINGMRVENSAYEGYTLITPKEFSGYVTVDGISEKVFTLNKDTTEVKKLKAEERLMMSPLQIVSINTSSNVGWGFIKYLD